MRAYNFDRSRLSYSLENGSLSYKLDDNKYLILLIDKRLSKDGLIVAYDKVIPNNKKSSCIFTYHGEGNGRFSSRNSYDATDEMNKYENKLFMQRCFIFDLMNNKIIRVTRHYKYYYVRCGEIWSDDSFYYKLDDSDCIIKRIGDYVTFNHIVEVNSFGRFITVNHNDSVDIYSLKDSRMVSITKEEFEELKKKDKANRRKRVKEKV